VMKMAFTVPVIGIFTKGAVFSTNFQQRRFRFLTDIASANQVWRTGFSPGVSCGINFVSAGWFNFTDVTIDAGTVQSLDDPRITNLIRQVRRYEGVTTAIYVVYLGGLGLPGGANGIGGPRFSFFRSTTDYGLFGQIALTNFATQSFGGQYVFAHESGHVLFGRFLNTNPNSFTNNDPSNPGSPHNNNPQNLMFPVTPRSNPFINAQQCTVARQSKVIIENAGIASRTRPVNRTPNKTLLGRKEGGLRRPLKKTPPGKKTRNIDASAEENAAGQKTRNIDASAEENAAGHKRRNIEASTEENAVGQSEQNGKP